MARSGRTLVTCVLLLLPLLLAGAALPAAPSQPADTLTIPNSSVTPTVDGSCVTGGLEYGDANVITFTVGIYPVQVNVKHTVGDLYVCLSGLIIPDVATRNGPNAVVYIDRAGVGGSVPNSDTFAFTVSYSGTVTGLRGGSNGYNGPAPLSPDDFLAARVQGEFSWSAEFAISHALLGGADWTTTGQTIGIAFAQQWVTAPGDDYGWPNGYIWSVPDTWGRGHISSSGGSSSLNYHWNALEVTQSIQSLFNSVVLVANKRTFVRGHVLSNQTRGPVTARLLGSRGGVSLGSPLLPANPGGTIIGYLNPSRGSLNDSFLWELPSNWTTAGTLSLTAELNPFHNPSESSYADNEITASGLNFLATHPLRIRLYDVVYQATSGVTVTTSLFDQQMLESWLRREYPISGLASTRRTVTVVGSDNPLVTNIGTAAGWVNGLMDRQRNLTPGNDPGWLYVGQVGPQGGFMRGITPWSPAWTTAAPTGGTPFCPSYGGPCFDFDGSFGDWYGAHEIGHALGRPHVGRYTSDIGCGADFWFFQPEYPYQIAIIGGPIDTFDFTDRFFGFDAGDSGLGQPIRVIPNTWTDNMSYCSNEWISDWTYTNLRDYIQGAFATSALAAPPEAAGVSPSEHSTRYWPYAVTGSPLRPSAPAAAVAAPAQPAAPMVSGDFLFVHAAILTTTNTASIDLISRLPEVAALPPLAAGGYQIRLFNNSNSLLTTYPVSPVIGSEGGAGLLLSQIVTFTAGTRRVALYSVAAGHEIASVTVSAHAPSVSNVNHTGGSILPAAGPVNVTWDANDADGDPLRYEVQYSFSGSSGPWRVLASGISSPSFSLDAAELESTGHGALSGFFRVVASDGVNTGLAISNKFSVADKAPVAHIASPVNLSQYGFGQTVSLAGEGQDFEDGTLDGAALSWSSSLDGYLGSGPEINPTFLSVGLHTVTLTVTDTEGLTGTASVLVQIENDASLLILVNPQLDVAPSAGMMFLGTAGGPHPPAQGLTVHDLAGTSLPFTVTVDQPWAVLSAASGNTPATISVTVSLAGMLGGTTRTAHVTIGAPGALASPQVVILTLQAEGSPPRRLFLPVLRR